MRCDVVDMLNFFFFNVLLGLLYRAFRVLFLSLAFLSVNVGYFILTWLREYRGIVGGKVPVT